MNEARYDGFADWFDREFANSEHGLFGRRAVAELLGPGTGTHDAGFGLEQLLELGDRECRYALAMRWRR